MEKQTNFRFTKIKILKRPFQQSESHSSSFFRVLQLLYKAIWWGGYLMLVVGIRVTALAHWSPYVYTGAGVCCCWRPLYSTAASPADWRGHCWRHHHIRRVDSNNNTFVFTTLIGNGGCILYDIVISQCLQFQANRLTWHHNCWCFYVLYMDYDLYGDIYHLRKIQHFTV